MISRRLQNICLFLLILQIRNAGIVGRSRHQQQMQRSVCRFSSGVSSIRPAALLHHPHGRQAQLLLFEQKLVTIMQQFPRQMRQPQSNPIRLTVQCLRFARLN